MIRFGTSGWRAIIGDEFTFENVRKVTQAIANHIVEETPDHRKIVIGYDTRFLSDRFAHEAAGVLAGNGFEVHLSNRDAPTPVIAHAIIERGMSGGINFTASHNPSVYNGLKFSTADGAPAPPSVTQSIEKEISRVDSIKIAPPAIFDELVTLVDLRDSYVEKVRELVHLDVLNSSGLRVGFDALYGTSREYLDHICMENGVEVHPIHNYLDPYFGGATPDCKAENLRELKKMVSEKSLDLGLATDGDGDRFGIVGSNARYVPSNYVLSLLAFYLTSQRGWRNGLGRTVATTHMIDRIAAHFDIPVYETPVGFKYLGEKFISGEIHFGGEESSGLSILGHVPEKDGIIADLLVAEMVAREKKTIEELLQDLFDRFGPLYSKRVDLELSPEKHKRAAERLSSIGDRISDFEIVRKDRTDGLKCYANDGSWLLFRLSGTEPIIRIYAESEKKSKLSKMLTMARTYMEEEA